MRCCRRWLFCGLLALGCAAPVLARDEKGKGSEAPVGGDYGTSVHFEKSPKEAAAKARQQEKLVFVVHISGLFEDSDYT